MRRKVEELEQDKDSLTKQVKELNEKLTAAAIKNNASLTNSLRRNSNAKGNNLSEEKIKVITSHGLNL